MLTAYLPVNATISDGTIIPFRDIFVQRNFLKNIFSERDYILPYTVKSGDTPRSLAYYIYGSERYEWIIYCLNSIVNPYYDWPLSEDDFYNFIGSKYLNKKCLFLNLDSFVNNFKVGETITSGQSSARVSEWNRTLCRLTIENVSGNFQIGNTITSNSSSAVIGRIVDRAEDAVNHFETQNGFILDPLVGYIQSYISSSNDQYVITNIQYEEKLNNQKRQIYVLKPEYARTAENLMVKTINKLVQFDNENLTL
jgi:hypothetical protein